MYIYICIYTYVFVRSPLGEGSARRMYLYLTTHSTDKIQTAMPPTGFEYQIPTRELLQTCALDRAATAIGCECKYEDLLVRSSYRSQFFGTIYLNNVENNKTSCLSVLDIVSSRVPMLIL